MEQASGACANVKRQEFCIMDVMAMANLEVADDPFYSNNSRGAKNNTFIHIVCYSW